MEENWIIINTVTERMYLGRLQKLPIYTDCRGHWRSMETMIIFDRGYRNAAKVIITGKDKVAHRAVKTVAEESLWFTNVPHLLLSFPIFLVDRDLLYVNQNCLSVHMILKSVYLPPMQSIMRPLSCSPSALSTVKHVMIALTLGFAHRFMEPLEKLKLSMQCTSLSSAEVLVILQTRENRKDPLPFYKHRWNGPGAFLEIYPSVVTNHIIDR